MPLSVACFCSYLASIISGWRQSDWDAYKFVHATKGNPVRGYASIPVVGRRRRLNSSNAASAATWFGEMVENYLDSEGIRPPFGLVPIPTSSFTKSTPGSPTTAKLAKAIAQQVGQGAKAVDCLRWKKVLPSASKQGGPRDARTLYDNLLLIRDLEPGPHILVDDVLTGGGHMQACTAFLEEKGATVILGVCAGRTVHEQPRDPFRIIVEELDDFNP